MAVSVVMHCARGWRRKRASSDLVAQEGRRAGQEKGDMLLEVETDKAVVEIEAQADGVLGGVTAKVGDVVPVGRTIGWLLKPGALCRRRPRRR